MRKKEASCVDHKQAVMYWEMITTSPINCFKALNFVLNTEAMLTMFRGCMP